MRVTRRNLLRSTGIWASAAALPAAVSAGADPERREAEAPSAGLASEAVSLRDIEAIAGEKMSREAWEFINSGAADELTVWRNIEAFQALSLHPRALADVSKLDTRVTLFGRELPHPILISPTASHGLVHPDAEVATAQGAAAARSTLVVSTFSTRSLEEIARAAREPLWHATYIMKDRGATKDLLGRAKSAGFEAIVIPVDSPVVGARDREHRTYRFKDKKPITLSEYPANFWRYPTTWKDIEWARGATDLPLVLKGILHPEDAERAVGAGASGIFVSNHGGRNLDTLPSTIEVLPEIAHAVAGRIPILLDGGIRRGTDVLKALSLGARAVSVGRPSLYGLAMGGAAGVTAVINILRNELEMAMALTGRPTMSSLDPSVIYPPKGEGRKGK
ncbi:MAG TPA: alpha-hydroxy acid oxidase [Planctomycetota bacterium]|nr:alpha-hydroxy acid oxidase [Planctomycetota bacterium]